MPTKLDVECPNGHIDVVVLAADLTSVDVAMCVLVEKPCPQCGGLLTAPAGHYEKHPDGTLVRVGT